MIDSFLKHRAVSGRCTWLPQTYFREMTLLEGALSNLGSFSASVLDVSVRLNISSIWRSMKKAQSQLAMESQPVRQPAATFDEMGVPMSRPFVSYALGEIPNPCPPDSALESLRAAIACEQSIRTGSPARIAGIADADH